MRHGTAIFPYGTVIVRDGSGDRPRLQFGPDERRSRRPHGEMLLFRHVSQLTAAVRSRGSTLYATG